MQHLDHARLSRAKGVASRLALLPSRVYTGDQGEGPGYAGPATRGYFFTFAIAFADFSPIST